MTARLSKRFYDVLGEDIATELVDWFNAVDATYRADLRDFNELNYARFDAKLEQRVAELRSDLRAEIAELRAELREGLANLGAELRGDIANLGAEFPTAIAGLRVEFRTELHQVRTELLRWMFGFWVTTFIGIAGLLIALRGH